MLRVVALFSGVLTELNLRSTGSGPKGASAIGKALEGNEVLKNLYMGYNDIGDEGAAAIAEALRGNEVLTVLNLYWNNTSVTRAPPPSARPSRSTRC